MANQRKFWPPSRRIVVGIFIGGIAAISAHLLLVFILFFAPNYDILKDYSYLVVVYVFVAVAFVGVPSVLYLEIRNRLSVSYALAIGFVLGELPILIGDVVAWFSTSNVITRRPVLDGFEDFLIEYFYSVALCGGSGLIGTVIAWSIAIGFRRAPLRL